MLEFLGEKEIELYKVGEGINREIVFPKDVTLSFSVGEYNTDVLIPVDKIVCKGLSIRFCYNNNEIAYSHLNHLALNARIKRYENLFTEDGKNYSTEHIDLISE